MPVKKKILWSIVIGLMLTIVTWIGAFLYYKNLMSCSPGAACILGYPSNYFYFGWPFRYEHTTDAFFFNWAFWSVLSFVALWIIDLKRRK